MQAGSLFFLTVKSVFCPSYAAVDQIQIDLFLVNVFTLYRPFDFLVFELQLIVDWIDIYYFVFLNDILLRNFQTRKNLINGNCRFKVKLLKN